jgi:hypothetical protein
MNPRTLRVHRAQNVIDGTVLAGGIPQLPHLPESHGQRKFPHSGRVENGHPNPFFLSL